MTWTRRQLAAQRVGRANRRHGGSGSPEHRAWRDMKDRDPVFPRPDAFRAWLAAFPPGADCGLADDPHRCPLAAWLASLGITAEVHPEERVWTTGGRDYLLPPWAVRFGLDVDGLFEDAYGAPVPALLALSALERATDRPWLAAESTDWL